MDVHFTPPGEGLPGRRALKATGQETRGAYALAEGMSPVEGTPLHLHQREDEAWFVLEGEIIFKVGDKKVTAPAGSFVIAPRGIPHAHKSAGPNSARFIAIVSPPGFEGFFGEQMKLRAAGAPSEDFAALATRYGVEELGPVDWS